MGHVSGGIGGWLPAIDPATGAFVLPLWLAAVVAALLVAFGVTLFSRVRPDMIVEKLSLPAVEKLSRAGLVLVGAAAAWIVLDAMSPDRFAPERQSLDARLLEITARAVAPGSALSCLSGTADEAVETSCEKALFATPEAAAAAVAYVAAQISVLADGADYERRSARSYESMLAGIRLAVETDRFGIVAHVLATQDGCTAERCNAFAVLRNPSQVSENLAGRRYEFLVARHAADWGAGAPIPVAGADIPSPAPLAPPPVASAAPAATAKKNLFFPSSASIPPVSIMAPEPSGPQPAPPTPDASAKPPLPPPPPPARKPGAPTQLSPRPSNATSSTTPAAASSPAATPAAPTVSAHPAPGQASD